MTARNVQAVGALSILGLSTVAPQDVLFWTGAGISYDAPTCGPLGGELTERALSHLFEPDCLSDIRDCYRELSIARPYPRLETVLDVVRRIIGVDAFIDVLSDLIQPQPNDLHGFFARHLDAGGKHATANFDDCIERSLPTTIGSQIIHFHGSFVGDPTGERLGATLGVIQRGFPADLSEQLRQALAAADVIVFAGYSGYDAFDVGPFLRSLGPGRELAGKRIVWVRFRPSGDDLVTLRDDESQDERVRESFARLVSAGANCWEVEGELRACLAALADGWSWPAPALHGPAPCSTPWTGTFVPTDDQRERASLEGSISSSRCSRVGRRRPRPSANLRLTPQLPPAVTERPPRCGGQRSPARHRSSAHGASSTWRAAGGARGAS